MSTLWNIIYLEEYNILGQVVSVTYIMGFITGIVLTLNPDISMKILHTVLHAFSMVIVWRFCLTIKTFVTSFFSLNSGTTTMGN